MPRPLSEIRMYPYATRLLWFIAEAVSAILATDWPDLAATELASLRRVKRGAQRFQLRMVRSLRGGQELRV